MIPYFDASAVERALPFERLADALAQAFARGASVPVRHVHRFADEARLLLMPAWTVGKDNDAGEGAALGVKLVTVQPRNAARSLPTVNAIYVLFDGATGVPRALIDGETLTLRRTAAMSALAARYLARDETHTLLVIGSGALAPYMARAHVALRPALRSVLVWGRNAESTEATVAVLLAEGLPVQRATDLRSAVAQAQIISCATTATSPVVFGDWLVPGTHLDLVGGFTRDMREVDDAAVARATIYVDTREGVLSEAGDLIEPIESGVITRDAVVAELAELVRGERRGRVSPDQITLYKSVGTALADLAAAQEVVAPGVVAAA